MSERHLNTGDALPPLEEGKTRIYSMAFCPFSHRCRMVLAHKNVPHEVVSVNLRSQPEWFTESNSLGVVPTLQQGEKFLRESAIINDYLDELYPDNKLYPHDPYAKAQHRLLMDALIKITGPYYKALWGPDDGKPEAIDNLANGVDFYEKALKENFFGGDKLGMTDIHIWPWFERITSGKAYIDFELTADRYPKLSEWRDRMYKTRAVKAAFLEPKVHQAFFKSFRSGTPNYDIMFDV